MKPNKEGSRFKNTDPLGRHFITLKDPKWSFLDLLKVDNFLFLVILVCYVILLLIVIKLVCLFVCFFFWLNVY